MIEMPRPSSAELRKA